GPFQPWGTVKGFEIGLERTHDRAVVPVGMAGDAPQAGGGFEDFADAFPWLVADKAGELAKGGDVGGIVEDVLAKNPDQSLATHMRGKDQKDEMTFGALATPERAVMARKAEIAVAA